MRENSSRSNMLLQLNHVRPVLTPTSFNEASSPHEVVSPRLFITLPKHSHFLASPIHSRFEDFHIFHEGRSSRMEQILIVNSPVCSIPCSQRSRPTSPTASEAAPLAEAGSDLPRTLCRPLAFPHLLPSACVFQPLFINSQPAAICRARESKKQKTSRVKTTRSAPAKGAPTHCDVFVGRLRAHKDMAALIY